jgi:hypothetical protein
VLYRNRKLARFWITFAKRIEKKGFNLIGVFFMKKNRDIIGPKHVIKTKISIKYVELKKQIANKVRTGTID